MSDILHKYAAYVLPPASGGIRAEGGFSVRSLGVTGLLFDDGSTKLLFDAMVSHPDFTTVAFGELSPDESLVEQVVRYFAMEDLSGIFISHSHYDHVLDAPAFLRHTGADLYGSRSTLNILRGNAIPESRLREFAPGETYALGDFTVTVLPSRHSKPAFFNNDLGKEIPSPLPYPARRMDFKEGGSFDFLVTHRGTRVLIHPSGGYLPGALADIRADVLFLGIARLSKLDEGEKEAFYRETVGAVEPKTVIPVHWDNFLLPLNQPNHPLPRIVDDTDGEMDYLIGRLEKDHIDFRILPALQSVEL